MVFATHCASWVRMAEASGARFLSRLARYCRDFRRPSTVSRRVWTYARRSARCRARGLISKTRVYPNFLSDSFGEGGDLDREREPEREPERVGADVFFIPISGKSVGAGFVFHRRAWD